MYLIACIIPRRPSTRRSECSLVSHLQFHTEPCLTQLFWDTLFQRYIGEKLSNCFSFNFSSQDTLLAVNFNGVFMNEDIFEEPWIFKPERFLNEKKEVEIPEHFIPFGVGKAF